MPGEGYTASDLIAATLTDDRDSSVTITISVPDRVVCKEPGQLGGVCMNSNGINNVTITIYDLSHYSTPDAPHGKIIYKRSWSVTYQKSDMDWFGDDPINFNYGALVDIDGTGGECIVYTRPRK